MGIGKVAQKAVFLDRDGVLNPTVLNPATGRMESPLNPSDFRLCDGVIPALLRLQRAGYLLILVSNQPNFALGKSSLDTLNAIHHELATDLLYAGVHFTRFCYCLHHPKGVTSGYSGLCVCRKPSPWFLLRARDDFHLSLADSWMIGDQPTDIQCGKAAGVRTIHIAPAKYSDSPALSDSARQDPCAVSDYVVRNLPEAADILLDPPAL